MQMQANESGPLSPEAHDMNQPMFSNPDGFSFDEFNNFTGNMTGEPMFDVNDFLDLPQSQG
jgi:hypothetical protein